MFKIFGRLITNSAIIITNNLLVIRYRYFYMVIKSGANTTIRCVMKLLMMIWPRLYVLWLVPDHNSISLTGDVSCNWKFSVAYLKPSKIWTFYSLHAIFIKKISSIPCITFGFCPGLHHDLAYCLCDRWHCKTNVWRTKTKFSSKMFLQWYHWRFKNTFCWRTDLIWFWYQWLSRWEAFNFVAAAQAHLLPSKKNIGQITNSTN